MNALFKITASEFNDSLFLKLKDLLKQKPDAEIIISVMEKETKPADYFRSLDRSIQEISQGNYVEFSMEELEKYIAEQDAV